MDDKELDAINEKVAKKLGWFKLETPDDSTGYIYGWKNPHRELASVPNYSRDIKAAWIIVEHISKLQPANFNLCGFLSRYTCDIGNSNSSDAYDTAPLAICFAFLKLKRDESMTDEAL